MINLEHLNDEERDIIEAVILRDENERLREADRVKKLKSELHQLRKKGALKVGGEDGDNKGDKKACHRCQQSLGLIFNSGDLCSKCSHKICNDCQVMSPSGKTWLCTVCDKQMEIKLGGSNWIGYKSNEDKNYRALHGTPLVKAALQSSRATSVADENEDHQRFYQDDILEDEDHGSDYSEESDERRSPQRNVTFGTSLPLTMEEDDFENEDEHSDSTLDNATQHRSLPEVDQSENQTVKVEVYNGENGSYVPSAPSPKPVIDTSPKLTGNEWDQMLNDKLRDSASRTSLTSLYSNAEESYRLNVTGDINYGTSYNFKTNTFEVKIMSCRDLVPVDTKRNRSNPYVKLYLLPDRTRASKRKTNTQKRTINPVFSETVRYKLRQSELETRTMCVAVWHYDRFKHNLFLGEHLLSLDTVQFDDYSARWHPLSPRVRTGTSTLTYTGDLNVAIMYEPISEKEEKDMSSKYHKGKKNKAPGKLIGGTLHVQIKEAKNLVGMKMGGSSSPFCKCYLLPDRSKAGKKKTTVKRGTCNPKWSEMLKFSNVTRDSLLERCVEVTVWDYDSVGTNVLIGGVRLGLGSGKSYGKAVDWMDSSSKEITVWREMLKNPNHWVETMMTLRGNVGKGKK